MNKYLSVREIAVLVDRHPNTVRRYLDRAEFARYRYYKNKKNLFIYWCEYTETTLRKLLAKAENVSRSKKLIRKLQLNK